MKLNITKLKTKVKSLDLVFLLPSTLLAVYPLLAWFSNNIQEIAPILIWQPLVLAIIANAVIAFVVRFLVRDTAKTGLILCIFWIFFYFYGVFFSNADKILAAGLVRHKLLWPLWIGLCIASIYLIYRSKRIERRHLSAVTIFSIVLVVIQVININNHSYQPSAKSDYNYLVNSEDKKPKDNVKRPNIYYIMPDSYPRSDTLKEHFDFDNSQFENQLKSKKFSIIVNSRSNYNQTKISMPATMNMSYLADKPEGLQSSELIKLYQKNKVMDFLRPLGYKFVYNSNLYWARSSKAADYNVDCQKSNEFFDEVLRSTAYQPFAQFSDDAKQNRRRDSMCVIDNISGPGRPGPKFVHSHLLPPHPPYIFGANGENVEAVNLSIGADQQWKSKDNYVNQLKYVNDQITQKVNDIISKDPESIIIIQSDHGTLSSATQAQGLSDKRDPVYRERHRNFMAIYLPDYCNKSIIPDKLTNVNTFRLVLNSCFGADYKFLPDKIYYHASTANNYKDFQDITKNVPN